jgi:hypothetical protein
VIQSNVVPNTSVLQTPCKQKKHFRISSGWNK